MRSLLFSAFALAFPLSIAGQGTGTPRPAITGISHVTFYADNLASSKRFYTSVLGWVQVPPGPAQSGVRFYANHAQYIQLVSPPRPDMANRFDSVGFSTSDAEGLRTYLAVHGIKVPKAVMIETDGSKSFVAADPEGNKVEFSQPGSHGPDAPQTTLPQISNHIIHAGFVAHDRAALDGFYKDLLGFHLYWQGGSQPGHIDWVMMQVPEGTDWLEYMLYLPSDPSRGQLASANHFAPGVDDIRQLDKNLRAKGWTPSSNERPPLLGLDGKWQLDLFDPDGTRVEFMEFLPTKDPCCSAYTGPQPSASPAW